MFHCLNCDFRMINMTDMISNHSNHINHTEITVQTGERKKLPPSSIISQNTN